MRKAVFRRLFLCYSVAAAVARITDEVENNQNGDDKPDVAVIKNIAKAAHEKILLPTFEGGFSPVCYYTMAQRSFCYSFCAAKE